MMSHLTVQEEIVVGESQKTASKFDEAGTSNPTKDDEPGTSNPVKTGEPGTSNPVKAEEPLKKKTRAGGSANKAKDKTCVETCKPGKRSGCTIRGRGKPAGNLSCAEVDRRIEALGVNAAKASLCVKAAIQKGLIEIIGEDKEELNQVVYSDTHQFCGHDIDATLGDLLEQPDYGGDDYENGLENATVLCKVGNCAEDEEKDSYLWGRTYVTGMCEGRPTLIVASFTTTALSALALGNASMTTGKHIAMIVGNTILLGIEAFPARASPGAVVVALGTLMMTMKSLNVYYVKL